MNTGIWPKSAVIARNNFRYKSLSCWSYNIAVGCEHACRFCYVPSVSTNKMGPKLAELGVKDPDAEWGDYVFLRDWNKQAFDNSLRRATQLQAAELNADGNRAVMFCTTTDPYQVMRGATPELTRELQAKRRGLTRWALETIMQESDLNVRILTRSPLAKADFDLMARYPKRILFGMSIPTLDNRLAKVYEPKAPAPSARLDTLIEAHKRGITTYVAIAPTYPECDYFDMKATLEAVIAADPVTIFMEPINIRAENVARIAEAGREEGVPLKTRVFDNRTEWEAYAVGQLFAFEKAAYECGVWNKLHLWPDASLKKAVTPSWLDKWWNRISEWPK